MAFIEPGISVFKYNDELFGTFSGLSILDVSNFILTCFLTRENEAINATFNVLTNPNN